MNNTYDESKLKEMVSEMAQAFVKDYKCSLDDAAHFFYSSLIKNEEVAAIISQSANKKQLLRNAAVKSFIKKAKKELYYKLRQYKNTNESRNELAEALELAKQNPTEQARMELLEKIGEFHVSTQERLEDNEQFYRHLSEIGNPATIIDVGCAVQPLFFPVEIFTNLQKYVAVDKDKESIQLLNEVKNIFPKHYEWLHPRTWNISEGWEQLRSDYEVDIFDIALVLKVAPVVERVQPELLKVLGDIPAKKTILSGVKESMVKKRDVEHRERKSIMNFISAHQLKITGGFNLPNEFFIMVEL